MDPRKIIRDSAESEDYFFSLPHALEEADKDGITSDDIENVMIRGTINQKDPYKNRYRLRYKDIQIVVEIFFSQVDIITVMRDR